MRLKAGHQANTDEPEEEAGELRAGDELTWELLRQLAHEAPPTTEAGGALAPIRELSAA